MDVLVTPGPNKARVSRVGFGIKDRNALVGATQVELAGRRIDADVVGMADAAGFRKVCRFDEARAWSAAVPDILSAKGPTLVHVITEPGTQGPIGRSSSEAARYLQYSLSEWSEIVRMALAESS